MITLQTIRRVTVYADALLEPALTEDFLKFGAKGYTVVPCRGKGKHDTVEDLFVATDRVRIEVLAPPPVAERILAYVTGHLYKKRAVAACIESVDVAADDHF